MSAHVTISRIRARHQSEEKRLVLGALERHGWNVTATARDLEVPESGLRATIKAHGLDELQRRHALPAGRPRKEKP